MSLGVGEEVLAGCLDVVEGAVDDFIAFEILVGFLGADVDVDDGLDVVEAVFIGFVDEIAPFEAVEVLAACILIGAVVPLPSARMLRKDIMAV